MILHKLSNYTTRQLLCNALLSHIHSCQFAVFFPFHSLRYDISSRPTDGKKSGIMTSLAVLEGTWYSWEGDQFSRFSDCQAPKGLKPSVEPPFFNLSSKKIAFKLKSVTFSFLFLLRTMRCKLHHSGHWADRK